MKTKLLGIVFALFGMGVGVSMADRAMNYQETDARLTSVKVDCYVKSRKKELVRRDTNEVAYMDCGAARIAAKEFGYNESDVKKRSALTYEYVSPVDGTRQRGKFTSQNVRESYAVGQRVKIYAHTSTPSESRWY